MHMLKHEGSKTKAEPEALRELLSPRFRMERNGKKIWKKKNCGRSSSAICVLVRPPRRGYHSLVPSVSRPTKTVARFMEQLRIPSRLGHRQKIMARLHLGITSRLQGQRYPSGPRERARDFFQGRCGRGREGEGEEGKGS